VVISCAALVGAYRVGQSPKPSLLSAPPLAAPTTSPSPSSTSKPSSTRKPAATTTSPASSPRSFDGGVAQTQFGNVQVRVVVQGGKLVDVVPLQLTDDGGRSVSISAQAAPILRREALSAGSAKIDTVSGASYTSAGYIQSLQSALDAARAAGA
jgi:uncharacterized protein with FMN-binding domain